MYANMCRQYTVQIYAIGSGECHWTQKVNLEELITSPNPSFPRNMWKLKEPLVCMWPSEGFRDTTQKMTRSQIKGDSVGFGGIACLSKGCRRFEDNADTDTWNTSKALRRRCVIRAPDHQDLVEKWRAIEISEIFRSEFDLNFLTIYNSFSPFELFHSCNPVFGLQ